LVSVLMPALNEEARIEASVSAALAIPQVDEVIVIDDGSVDETGDLAAKAGAEVIRLQRNLGKGGALNAGLRRARGDVILTLDADLGLSAIEGAKLLAPVLAGQAHMTVGVFPRLGKGGGFGLAKGLAKRGILLLTGQQLREPLSGQRCLLREILDRCNGFAAGFGAEVGLTIDALRLGYRVLEVEVNMDHARTGRNLTGFRHRGRQFWHIFLALAARVGDRM
jgi:glycosyltransferase involved in cell wall biosynthesis